jgi:outer membrane protein assembly factor BamB
MGDMFSSADETPVLEGERISILELQKTLKVDAPLKENETVILPEAWQNPAWPQAGGFPNHSIHNLAFSQNTPVKLWSAKTGRGSRDDLPLNAEPIIAEGMVFTLDTKAYLHAFNAETGKRLWSRDVGSEKEKEDVITGGVAYAHGALFVTNGYDEALAISPKDGNILWRKTLPAPSRAAPSILSGRVYISTIDSRLIALNAADGAGLWEYRGVGETAGLLGAASPAVNQNTVIGVFSSGEVTALRVENGSVAWSDNLSGMNSFGGGLESLSDITAMPVMTSGLIITMSYNGKIAAIDERTGARVWQREIGGTRTPWVAGNVLYVLSSENQLIGMNMKDGSIFWITQLDRFKDEKDMEGPIQWSAPIMAGNRLILTSSHGLMVEVNPQSGEVYQRTKTKDDVQLTPVLANDILYTLAENGKLVAYR